ncbi:MAG: Hpt domain-containing protein [Planctomycetota bacterium]|nr:Hpt domain-containing protein [Planctomycetota bacterium]
MIDPDMCPGPIRSQFASDEEMRELVRMFVDEMPARIAALRDAWDASHSKQIESLAHQLKGAAAGYGFAIVGDAAAELESALRSSEHDLSSVRAQFDALVDLCSRAAC